MICPLAPTFLLESLGQRVLLIAFNRHYAGPLGTDRYCLKRLERKKSYGNAADWHTSSRTYTSLIIASLRTPTVDGKKCIRFHY
jgi:hypothetical protein